MFDLIIKGGPMMIPILGLSVICLAVILERLWVLHGARIDRDKFLGDVTPLIASGRLGEALTLCEVRKSASLVAITRAALLAKGREGASTAAAIEQTGKAEVRRLEQFTTALATMIALEPMLGFLGTIIGLIRAFMVWEQHGANVSISQLAGGIYQAMITTAAGLTIAIPYQAIYNYIVARIESIAGEMEQAVPDILNAFGERSEENRKTGKPA